MLKHKLFIYSCISLFVTGGVFHHRVENMTPTTGFFMIVVWALVLSLCFLIEAEIKRD